MHPTGAGAPSPRSSIPALLLWLAALAVVVVQAMALATRYFQPWLDADYLLPQRFAADVLAGVYPLSGWTLSSSPYLFPDFALSIVWHAVLGTEPVLPAYVVTSYVALALLAGWSLQQTKVEPGLRTGLRRNVRQPNPSGGRVPPDYLPWLFGALLVNALLACQGTADHARWLWWLGTATFHGGAVLLGLAQFALWIGPPESAPGRGRFAVATALLFLGLASDTLLLTQFVVPLAAALFMTAEKPRWRAPRVRAFVLSLLIALLAVVGWRGGLALADWWNFPSVVRYAPTPPAIAGAAGRMATDLAGPVVTAVPGFMMLLALGVAGAAWFSRRAPLTLEQRQARWFAVLCLLSTLALPALAVYWRNPQHGRYLLPCLVIPLWWLSTVLPVARLRTPFVAGIVTASLLGLTLLRAPRINFTAWAWPYPERVAELDRFLAAEKLHRGLADFWNAHYLSTVSQTGLRLNQLRPDGRVQFWGNNAFHHYETDPSTGALHSPRYTFIVANGLDPAALRQKFGEPARIAGVGEYQIWLYDETGAGRMSALVDGEVRAFLGDRPGTERMAPP